MDDEAPELPIVVHVRAGDDAIDLDDWPRDQNELLLRLLNFWARSVWLVCN